MYELGGAKQAGSTYAHGGPAGKRGRSLRAHRNFPIPPLPSGSPDGQPSPDSQGFVVYRLMALPNNKQPSARVIEISRPLLSLARWWRTGKPVA